MPGDFSDTDLVNMTPAQVAEAAANGWVKPVKGMAVDPADAPADRPDYAGVSVSRPQPSGDVWKRRKAGEDVFTCPSGQTCRLRPLSPERLLMAGILDRVTRLEGLAEQLVQTAEGAPPLKDRMPSREDFAELLTVINAVIPLAVAEPTVLPDPEDGGEVDRDALYVSDIDLDDRMAIMAEALKGIRAMDRFRNAG